MHIAINAHLLAHTSSFRRAGVSHYVESLLAALGALDTDDRYTVYTTRGLGAATLGLPANFTVRPSLLPTINPRIRIPWEQFLAPPLLRLGGADVYHGVLNVVPLACPVPSVVTIHDLSAFLFPQTFRRINRSYTRWAIKVAARRSARILAVSQFTKDEIVRWLGVAPERIVVTHNAADARFAPPSAAELAAFRARASLPDQFILFLGTLEPRKNIATLLTAYAQIAATTQVPLLIAGAKGWLYEPVLAQIERLGLGEKIRLVGYIPQEDQPLWYAAATAFVFPSLYEGFGMPPLEAMACGAPTIVSRSSSLPEVVGDAALLCDPHDPEDFADALHRVLTDAVLRDDLRRRGIERATHFSWDETARRTLQVYRTAAGG